MSVFRCRCMFVDEISENIENKTATVRTAYNFTLPFRRHRHRRRLRRCCHNVVVCSSASLFFYQYFLSRLLCLYVLLMYCAREYVFAVPTKNLFFLLHFFVKQLNGY